MRVMSASRNLGEHRVVMIDVARHEGVGRDLQLPHSLFGQIDTMLRSELLGSQCRPKIRVR
jgi:hypothetical protein